MLAISSEDISRVVSRKEVADAVEQAMLTIESGDYIMPNRMHLHSGNDTMLIMPCISKGMISTKLVSVFPNNRDKGLPSLYGTLILNDGKTGEPLAIMNGATITALRTGAVGGVGVRHLAKKDAKALLVIGTGVQGRNLALSACLERKFQKVFTYDINFENAITFSKELQKELMGIDVVAVKSVNQGLLEADVVITATTSETPVLPLDKKLMENKCFIGIGSFKPNTRELPEELLSLTDTIFVDTPFAASECGDLAIPLASKILTNEKIVTIGKLINKAHQVKSPTRVFKSVGVALFDLFTANLIYQKALESGAGKPINL
ncbi:MAG: ornithine cyclodeaminase family protein [Bacteroidales bacterium]|nr:MAG: ornithine cyclodeaminase family protein [Bacteroidales bacterium]